jgi:PhnB protein
MPHPVPYLSFDGSCKRAMRFYDAVLRGKLVMMVSVGESPMAEFSPPEAMDRIVHARLELPDGGVLMAGDAPVGEPYEGIKGVCVALAYDSAAEAHRVFDALAIGGSVTMPMQATFWAKAYGMVTDRFGTPWAINGEQTRESA